MIVDKVCEKCGVELTKVNHQTRYCISCREASDKQSTQRYKKKTRKEISKNKEIDLIENFSKVVTEHFHLTPLGFDTVSKISYNSYLNFYKKPWIEILKQFNRYDELIEYILNEYKSYINKTNNQSFNYFTNDHEYIGKQLIKTIGYEYIRNRVNIQRKRNSSQDYKNEFNRLISLYNRPPLYFEFAESSKYSINGFKSNLKVSEYDLIVKSYVDENTYEQYLINKKAHKTEVGRNNHQGFKYTEEDLENNFTNIFSQYKNQYDDYPSLHLFDKISPISYSTYNNRLNKTWNEICECYGFESSKRLNKSENIALGIVGEILNEKAIPQKTFDWLIGFKGFPLFCDGYFPDHKLIIEFDGDQHRYPSKWFGGSKTLDNIRTNDKYKEVLIPRNGLKLVRISSEEPYWDKEYITNKLINNGIKVSHITPSR